MRSAGLLLFDQVLAFRFFQHINAHDKHILSLKNVGEILKKGFLHVFLYVIEPSEKRAAKHVKQSYT